MTSIKVKFRPSSVAGSGTVDNEFNNRMREHSFFGFMESNIVRLRQNGRTRTSETYRAALNSFSKFRHGEDIMLEHLDSETMEANEAWQHSRGLTPNTISFYTRILRAAYNRAVEEGIIENHNPFRRVYTGIDKTVKRALPLTVIRKIKELDLSATPSLDYARDMFMMSFYLRVETPREFDPRGQATMPPADKIPLTLYVKIKLTPENDCFSGAFL